jgi:hypothetical protein
MPTATIVSTVTNRTISILSPHTLPLYEPLNIITSIVIFCQELLPIPPSPHFSRGVEGIFAAECVYDNLTPHYTHETGLIYDLNCVIVVYVDKTITPQYDRDKRVIEPLDLIFVCRLCMLYIDTLNAPKH